MKGMNWSNYGDWHMDDVRPVPSFSLMGLTILTL